MPCPAHELHFSSMLWLYAIPSSSEAPAQLEWQSFELETSKGLLSVPTCDYVYFHLWIKIKSFSSWQFKKKKAFQICNYTINTPNVKIEQHMAKEIMGINQLNGMTQTDMIRQICILQWGLWGHGKRTSPNANNESQTSKNNWFGKKYLQERKRYEILKAYKLRTSDLLLDVSFLFNSGFHNTYLMQNLLQAVPEDYNIDHKFYTS